MISGDGLLGYEYLESRPGLRLVWIEDAALPMAWVSVEVLAQERKAIPLLDEFVLRLIEEGIDQPKSISQVLGLDEDLVSTSLAEQLMSDRVRRASGPDGEIRYQLTVIGHDIAGQMASITPKEHVLGLSFDLLARTPAVYPKQILIGSREVNARGLRRLPSSNAMIDNSEITPTTLNPIVSEFRGARGSIEVLACTKVVKRAALFLPVKLLVFFDEVTEQCQVAVSIEGSVSRAHELALSQQGGADKIGLAVVREMKLNLYSEIALDAIPLEEVLRLWSEQCQFQLEDAPASAHIGHEPDGPFAKLATIGIRPTFPFECWDALQTAVREARARLIISCKKVHLTVEDHHWIDLLANRVRGGLSVTIRYEEQGGDAKNSAFERLKRLVKENSGRMDILQVDSLRVWALVWDHKCILGEFPWLSRQADHERPRRSIETLRVVGSGIVDSIVEQVA